MGSERSVILKTKKLRGFHSRVRMVKEKGECDISSKKEGCGIIKKGLEGFGLTRGGGAGGVLSFRPQQFRVSTE